MFCSHRWKGEIELRGLKPGSYRVGDYVNGRDLGKVVADEAKLIVEFAEHLLLEARRQ